ncbi:MAG: MFS transporter [Bacteroidia bacterium]|nr:MFS transporter [Bacteroidia bacterium]
MKPATNPHVTPWHWIPTLYFIQGLPYVTLNSTAPVMYKLLGVGNAEMAFFTSWLSLPWVIKPLWSPLVEILGAKRFWIVTTQFVCGAALACVALALPGPDFFKYSLAFFWLIAFSSATHDIAADGFYLLALREGEQAFFVGIRSIFYRVAMIAGQGLMVILAGYLSHQMPASRAWMFTLGAVAVLLALAAAWHVWRLPRPAGDVVTQRTLEEVIREFWAVFVQFFKRKQILLILAFLLLYRIGEAQLVKIVPAFLLDAREDGGLGLTAEQQGLIYGTIALGGLILGGIAGGILISRFGLKRMLWWMIAAINLPNFSYVLLALWQPEQHWITAALVTLEQMGYGFGFTAFMMYLVYISQGPYQTAHYAIGTGFMALGMLIPGMFSGVLQERLGYFLFFLLASLVTILPAVLALWIPLDPDFGKQKT